MHRSQSSGPLNAMHRTQSSWEPETGPFHRWLPEHVRNRAQSSSSLKARNRTQSFVPLNARDRTQYSSYLIASTQSQATGYLKASSCYQNAMSQNQCTGHTGQTSDARNRTQSSGYLANKNWTQSSHMVKRTEPDPLSWLGKTPETSHILVSFWTKGASYLGVILNCLVYKDIHTLLTVLMHETECSDSIVWLC